MASNYSFYSLPVYWFLALVPHAYAVRPGIFRIPQCAQAYKGRLVLRRRQTKGSGITQTHATPVISRRTSPKMLLRSTSELKRLTQTVWRTRLTSLVLSWQAISWVSQPVSTITNLFFAEFDKSISHDEHLHGIIHWSSSDLQRSVYKDENPEDLSSAINCVGCQYHWSVHAIHQGCEQIPGRLIDMILNFNNVLTFACIWSDS